MPNKRHDFDDNTHKTRTNWHERRKETAIAVKEDKMNEDSSICLGYLIVLVIKPTAQRERHPERRMKI